MNRTRGNDVALEITIPVVAAYARSGGDPVPMLEKVYKVAFDLLSDPETAPVLDSASQITIARLDSKGVAEPDILLKSVCEAVAKLRSEIIQRQEK